MNNTYASINMYVCVYVCNKNVCPGKKKKKKISNKLYYME